MGSRQVRVLIKSASREFQVACTAELLANSEQVFAGPEGYEDYSLFSALPLRPTGDEVARGSGRLQPGVELEADRVQRLDRLFA